MKTLLVLMFMSMPVFSQTTNAEAYGYFQGPQGIALVEVIRTQDVNKVVTTELFYTFCGQANLGLSCQQGDGIIPNSAVTGSVSTNVSGPSVLSVNVDTSAMAGYRNQLCTQGIDFDGDCLGESVATGGLISISWTRTNEWANLSTSANKSYRLGKLISSSTGLLDVFSATQAGTVVGVNAAAGAVMLTSSDSETLKVNFAAKKAGNR